MACLLYVTNKNKPEIEETSEVTMKNDVPCLHHVTSNKKYDFCMFSKFVNCMPIDLKIGTHNYWTYTMYHANKCTNQNNITRISMTTKYPIIKQRAFLKTLTVTISPINT